MDGEVIPIGADIQIYKAINWKEMKITQEIVHIYNSMEGNNTSKSSS